MEKTSLISLKTAQISDEGCRNVYWIVHTTEQEAYYIMISDSNLKP